MLELPSRPFVTLFGAKCVHDYVGVRGHVQELSSTLHMDNGDQLKELLMLQQELIMIAFQAA